jgi:hypothetical protein
MGPEILIPISFFGTVAFIVRTVLSYKERMRGNSFGASGQVHEIATRLDRMEQAIEAIAVEVERVSEGQRFTTRLLSERSDAGAPVARDARAGDRLGA